MTKEEMRQELIEILGSTDIARFISDVNITGKNGATLIYNSIKRAEASAIRKAFEAFAEWEVLNTKSYLTDEAKKIQMKNTKEDFDQFLKEYENEN